MSPHAEAIGNSYEIPLDHQLSVFKEAGLLQDDTPKRRYSKEDLLHFHSNNIRLQEVESKEASYLVLPAAYAPSTASLNNLQKISFNDLKVEVHHRGCFVTASTITAPYVSTKIITIIEEEGGGVAKLEVHFQDSFAPDSDLPLNSTIAIKEPYYKYNGDGDYAIRVDHPSDIAVLRGDDPAVTMIMKAVSKTMEITSMEWKTAGDEAYLERSYSSAIECYTQAIDTASKDDVNFVRDSYRKRAYANLIARRFDVAMEDALASCSGEDLDARASYCSGRAAYELGLYEDSRDYFERALKLNPNNSKCKKDLNRALSRIEEQDLGRYDFKSMGESLSITNVHMDHANFFRNVEIRDTGTHGRGLYATRDLERGNLVLCEKALCFPNMLNGDYNSDTTLYNFNTNTRTEGPAQGALFLSLVQKLYNSPIFAPKFFDLDSGNYIRSGKEGALIDGVPIIDVFLIEAIRLRNGFSYHEAHQREDGSRLEKRGTSKDGKLNTGLWVHAAYMNHSCVPNAARSFIGDIMIIRAICDIPKGTEICHQYTSPEASYQKRQELFQSNWQFKCDCSLCNTESKSPESMHKQRRDLVFKIRKEVIKWPRSARVPEAVVRRVERMLKEIEALHEPEVYGYIPRLFLVHPTIWLTEVNRSKKNFAKTAKYAMEVLRNFGFMNPVREGKLHLEYQKGIVNSETFNALQYAMEAYRELGKKELAKQCEHEARLMFGIITGDSDGVEEALTHCAD